MARSEDDVLQIPLPERVDRRLRLGPFPSARDALKFLCYATTGALLAPLVSVPLGVAVGAAGFAAAVWRPDGQAWDERVFVALRWKWRSGRRAVSVTARPGRPLLRQGLLELDAGHYVAVVRSAGSPIAYLPPAELSRRFAQFQDLLRAIDEHFVFLSTGVAIHAAPLVPGQAPTAGPESAARAGYAELVRLLLKRRLGRRVYVALGTVEAKPEAIARLEGRVASLLERLSDLGLKPVRLRDRALHEAARRFGWVESPEVS